MIELGETKECEMILAFLRAEVDSPRRANRYMCLLTQAGFSRSMLIDNADLTNESHNLERRKLLKGVRGYPKEALFGGFPANVRWRRVEVEPHELARLKYAKERIWLRLSDDTRSVLRCVEKMERGELPQDPAVHIRAIQALLQTGKNFPELVAVEGQGQDLILVEGHIRATAYVASKMGFNAFLGSSPKMDRWDFH
jgi:hypothetical protein